MITEAEVISWMGHKSLNESETKALSLVVDAVNTYVDSLPTIDRNADGEWWDVATTRYGALLLAHRFYKRKSSTAGGVEAAGDSVAYVSRWDADIQRAFNMGTDYRKPVVG